MTRVIVAHRPETIASADRIIVLAEGQLMQREAMRARPITRELQAHSEVAPADRAVI